MAITITNVALDGATTTIRIDGDRIAAVGAEVTPQVGDELLDGSGLAAVPGLVNGHTHAAMTLFRGFGDDLPLMEWLEKKIWPAEAGLSAEDVYWGTRLACLEMIRSGTTAFFDMYWHGTAVARAATDAGVRATVSAVLIDGLDPENSEALRSDALVSLDELSTFGPLITPSLGPHAVYTVSGPSLEWIAETAAERSVPIHIHCSETEGEVERCRDANGATPAAYLDRLGALGPRTLLAHGNWLTPEEFALVAERGATVVTNPASNLKLAGGRIFGYPTAMAHGLALGMGTDGVSSNNNLDLYEEMKIFALIQKHAADDPSVAPAADVLALAQGARSQLLGGTPIEAGQPADLVLVDRNDAALVPGDLTANLVYSATGSVVRTTIVAGQVLLSDGVVADEDEIVAQVRRRAERLTAPFA